MYYKIILNNKANNIAHTIYEKIKDIRSEDRKWLVDSTNRYIYNHIELPLYDKEYLEKVIYEYGIQKAIEKFIQNKKCYDTFLEMVENDESKIYLGLVYCIVSEYFEFMSFEYAAA